MGIAKVLIPESARPDVVSPLIDDRSPPNMTHASGCKEGKDGGDKSKEVLAKDDKMIPAEISPAETQRAREYFGL